VDLVVHHVLQTLFIDERNKRPKDVRERTRGEEERKVKKEKNEKRRTW